MRSWFWTAWIALAACGPEKEAISILPAEATVLQGGTYQFTLTENVENVVWSVAEGPSGGNCEGSVYTAPRLAGTFHVVASVGGRTVATALVHVPPLQVSATALPPTVLPGAASRIQAKVNAVGHAVSWNIPNGSSGTVDQSGLYIAPSIPGIYAVDVAVQGTDLADEAFVQVVESQPGGSDLIHNPAFRNMPALRIHAIWWGDPESFPPDARAAIEGLVTSLSGSSVLAVADQYLGGAHAQVTFAGSIVDSASSPKTTKASLRDVEDEIVAIREREGLMDESFDQDLYLVLGGAPLNPDRSQGALCGWHGNGSIDGRIFLVAFVNSPAGSSGSCGVVRGAAACSTRSEGAGLMTVETVHEIFETITNPQGDAWLDSNNEEIADKCLGYYACMPMGGAVYLIQPEFSNAAHACIASTEGQ